MLGKSGGTGAAAVWPAITKISIVLAGDVKADVEMSNSENRMALKQELL